MLARMSSVVDAPTAINDASERKVKSVYLI